MSTHIFLAFIACIILIVGSFCPVIMGITPLANGEGFGVIIIALAVNAFTFLKIKYYKVANILSWLVLIFILFMMFIYHSKIIQVKEEANRELLGNPFRGMADLVMANFSLEWGWIVLLLGSLLLITAAVFTNKK